MNAAVFAPGVITTEPALQEVGQDGFKAYVCDATVEPFGRVIEAIILPSAPGAFSPWRKGDRVLLGLAGGGSGYVLGSFANAAGSTAHVEIQPRGDGEVRVGPAGGEYQPVALFDRLSAEVVNLKAQIGAITTFLGGAAIGTAPSGGGPVVGIVGPSSAASAVSTATIAGGITGGDPSKQFQAVKGP